MTTRRPLMMMVIGAVAAPLIANFLTVFAGWVTHPNAQNFAASAWLALELAPYVGVAVGCGALLVVLKRWWRFAVIAYVLVTLPIQMVLTAYFAMALLGEGP